MSVAVQCITYLTVEELVPQCKRGNLPWLKGWDGLAAEPAERCFCYVQSEDKLMSADITIPYLL